MATTDLGAIRPPTPNGKAAAVTGSGPASLSAAYHLCKQGYAVTVWEKGDSILTPYIQADKVPQEVIQLEVEVLKRMGIRFRHGADEPSSADYDLVATPEAKSKQPARLVLEGRRLAEPLPPEPFNSTYNRFTDAEKGRIQEPDSPSACLYCDCAAKLDCRLRLYASEYGVKNIRYPKSSATEAFSRQEIGKGMCFEPAKCIKCGLCVYNSQNGFTFKGRGFVMQTVIPEENISHITPGTIALCPTGALHKD